jgi:hypothetical protein
MPEWTYADYQERLRTQLRFLERSIEAYDDGERDEAVRLAQTIRIVCHGTNRSTSLLEHLKVVDSIEMLDTAGRPTPDNVLSSHPLTIIMVVPKGADGYAEHVPICDLPLSPGRAVGIVRFAEWWGWPVLIDQHGNRFTRKQLVTWYANKEGGAHYDPNFTAGHEALAHQNSIGWEYISGDTKRPLGSPIPATIRQVAEELRITFQRFAFDVAGWDPPPAPDVSGEWIRVRFHLAASKSQPVEGWLIAEPVRMPTRITDPTVDAFYRIDDQVMDSGLMARDLLMNRGRKQFVEWLHTADHPMGRVLVVLPGVADENRYEVPPTAIRVGDGSRRGC